MDAGECRLGVDHAEAGVDVETGGIMSTAVERRHCLACAGVACGFAWTINASTPETCADDIEVPEMQSPGAHARGRQPGGVKQRQRRA